MTFLQQARSVGNTFRFRYDIHYAKIDNLVFQLHYRYTTYLLFFLSALIAGNYFMRSPIMCFSIHSEIPGDMVNAYCWVAATYTVPTSSFMVPKYYENGKQTERRYQSYYQWVPLVLFFQGALFYFPHFLWKNWENARMFMLTTGLRGAVIDDWKIREGVQTRLTQFVVDRFNKFGTYAIQYLFCETLNLIIVIANVIFINRFFEGAFFSHGLEIINVSEKNQEHRNDTIVKVFPKVTKCALNKYGPSGSLENHDAVCILTSNMYNEKIYIFLWFWFLVLTLLSSLALAYSIAALISKRFRLKIIIKRFLVRDSSKLTKILKNAKIEDYFLLRQIGKNVNPVIFLELIDDIYEQMFPNKAELVEEEVAEEEHAAEEEEVLSRRETRRNKRTNSLRSRRRRMAMTRRKQEAQRQHIEPDKCVSEPIPVLSSVYFSRRSRSNTACSTSKDVAKIV